MTNIDPRLNPFADADTITWHRHTVFAPHRSDDGTLYADGCWADPGALWMPLDTYLPEIVETWAEFRGECKQPVTKEGVGIVVVDPVTIADVHNAVRQWCIDNLGRDDVLFDN